MVLKPGSPETELGLHAKLTRRIIAAAYRVHGTLGCGFLEELYRKALIIELEADGLSVQREVPIEVYYRGLLIGRFRADLLVEGVVIVELKAIEALQPVHETQLVNYLRATEIELGLVVNFGPKLQFKRKILTNDREGRL